MRATKKEESPPSSFYIMSEPLRCAFESQEIEPFYVGATSATLSQNGELLATPCNEDVVITDLTNNITLFTLEGDGEPVTALAMTPDGTRLAVVSQSQQLRIFDVQTGQCLKQTRLSAPVYIAAVDATSTLFAFGATDGLVTVWDIEGAYITHSLKGHGTTVCSLKFYGELHSSKWMLALGDTMGTCKIWNLVTRKCVASNNEHSGAVRGLAFSPEGDFFMSGGRDEVVVLYNTENLRRPTNTFTVRQQVESCGFFEKNGNLLFYTAGSGCQLRVWAADSGKPLGLSRAPLETLEELVVIDTIVSEQLWMVLSDQTLMRLDLARFGEDEEHIVPETKRIAGNHGIVADVRYCGPDRSLLALATNAPALRVVDPAAPFEVLLHEGHTDLLNCVDASEDGRWLLTGAKDNSARMWRWNDEASLFELYAVFIGHAGAVTACGLPKGSGEPRFVLTASADLTVKKWKVQQGTVRSSEYTRRAHDKEINALAVAPNNQLFATASFDKLAKVWDTDLGETVGVLRGHKRGLWDVSFCQYDKLVVTASGDKTAKVWLLTDYTCTKTLEGHTNAVQRCRFMNRNRQIVTSGADSLVKVWDISESECCATLDNHGNRIWALDVKDDGLAMVSVDADGRMNFWTDNTDELVKEREEQERQKIEHEQALNNYIQRNDWSNAFLLAVTLEHLMRVYNVIKSLIASNDDAGLKLGSFALEKTIQLLDTTQMAALLRRVRDWNINFKQFEIAQKVLAVVVDKLDMENPEIRKIVAAIVPYNERHYLRLDDLIEQTYMLDYVVHEMEKA